MLAGAGGVAAMTRAEKLEQRLTGRPGSYMLAHTLERLIGTKQRPDSDRRGVNLGMHVGQAILLGAWRGIMAEGGLRAARTSAAFRVIHLANDQTFENITGQRAPPWTWPRDELVIDVLHKTIYAFATGATPTLSRRTCRHGRRHADERHRQRAPRLGALRVAIAPWG